MPHTAAPAQTRDGRPLWKKVIGSLSLWLVLGMILGCVLGSVAPQFSINAAATSNVFMRPIQFVVFPLVFSSMVVGIASHGDLKKLGRLALKSFIYFEIVSLLALVFGLVAVNVVKPGNGGFAQVANPNITSTSTFTYALWINHLTPKTWGEMMGGSGTSELLQVLVAAILFGCATAVVPNKHHKQVILTMANAVQSVMFKFVDIIIWAAPIAVVFSIASVVGTAGGLSILGTLGKLVATLYVTCFLFIVIVFGTVCLLFKINPIELVIAMKEPLIIAYTTATSEAALPKVFEALEAYGVSTEITAFVVPFGYSFNLDGSTLHLSLAAMFCAQAAGVNKTLTEQIVMLLMLMVSSKGVAGVRSATVIVVSATLAQFDIPQWPIAVYLGVDWFMDMARTFTNVLGNCLAAVVMAKWEGEFRKEVIGMSVEVVEGEMIKGMEVETTVGGVDTIVVREVEEWKVVGSLTFWLFLSMIFGCLLGSVAPQFSINAAPTANLFMRPIQFIVFPLVFSSLVLGIASHGDLGKLGRLAIKTFVYFEIVSALALIFGLLAVNIVKPGDGFTQVANPNISSTNTFTYALWINHLTPKTWGEMMGGSGTSELLQVLTAAILFGCATAIVPNKDHKQVILTMASAVQAVMFKFVDIIIWAAPIAVVFSIAAVVGTAGGLSILGKLGKLVGALYITCLLFIVIVFGAVCLIFKINPVELTIAMKEPLIIAYTTATSEAALPKVFEALEEYGVSTGTTAFVVPFGYSFNLDGSTLYLSLAAVFCAQATNTPKSITEQIVMVLMLMISSKGVAGVRSASIIVLSATLSQFDIPQWPIGVILGADWFMDMARTFTNVMGNCLAAVAMAKWEGEFRKEVIALSADGDNEIVEVVPKDDTPDELDAIIADEEANWKAPA
ncbi:hypothetical protein HDU98_010753 [Podochytrium sp. JEL0797]|nr:hypothetical protein HDU98_010753 [Podochytrium sp. JEL0797]